MQVYIYGDPTPGNSIGELKQYWGVRSVSFQMVPNITVRFTDKDGIAHCIAYGTKVNGREVTDIEVASY